MSAFIDLTGQRFGKLVALKFLRIVNHRSIYLWQCDCGSEPFERMAQSVKCDCALPKCRKCDLACRADQMLKHGLSATRLHKIWIGARGRCRNPRDKHFADYGGRGINFSEELDDYSAFHQWATNNGYADNLELDRIDNDRGYEAGNCRWVDRKTQCRNQRKTRYFSYQGRQITIPELAEISGLHVNTIRRRLLSTKLSAEESINKGR